LAHARAPPGGVQRPPRRPGRRVQDAGAPGQRPVRALRRPRPRPRARRGGAGRAHGPLDVERSERVAGPRRMTAAPRPRGGWPRLAAAALLPAVNLALALALSAVVVVLIGESPWRALRLL